MEREGGGRDDPRQSPRVEVASKEVSEDQRRRRVGDVLDGAHVELLHQEHLDARGLGDFGERDGQREHRSDARPALRRGQPRLDGFEPEVDHLR